MSVSTKLSKTEVEALISGLEGADGEVSAAEQVAQIRKLTSPSDRMIYPSWGITTRCASLMSGLRGFPGQFFNPCCGFSHA